MKNIFNLFVLLIFSVFAISCSDDDDSSSCSSNTISTPGGNSGITGAFVEDYGAWDNGYNLDFTFISGDITVDTEGDPTSGAGTVAYFEMISPDEGNLAEGTYTYQGGGGPYAAYTYTDSSEISNVTDAANYEYTVIHDPTATVTIDRNGSSFTFTYNSGDFCVQYSGVPVFFDRTSRSITSKKGFFAR